MASDGTIKITTELDSTQAQAAMSKFGTITKTGCKIAATALATVSTGLITATGYAVKTGIEFESAFAGVKKTVDATDEELQVFRDGIRDMAKEIPQSAAAISEVAEAAGQLGIKNDYILDFTRTMSDLGVATNMTATEAATSLARLANITQMPQENFSNLGSTIVALGNNLATTESEITEMGLRLAGAGEQVGMTEAQILGLAGALSSVGIEADAGGSAMSTVMSKIQLAVEKGGDSLNQFADVAGMSADEFKQAFQNDAAQAIVAFVTGLGTMESRGKSAIGTLADMEITEIRQRDALLRLSGAGDVLAESLDIATQAWSDNNALTNEAEQRYETLESRLQILKNNVDDFGISIYDGLRDPLKNTVDEGIVYVEQLSNAFQDGGLKGAINEAGKIFADLSTSVAQQAPAMAESAVEFIQAFSDGIYNNRGELISAAGNIALTFAEGLSDLLPSSVSSPVKEAVEEIANSFKNGGLNTAVETTVTTFDNLIEVGGTVAKVTLPAVAKAVDLLAGNMKTAVPIAVSLGTAYKSLSIAKSAEAGTSALANTIKKGTNWWKTASQAIGRYAEQMEAASYTGRMYNVQLTAGQAVLGLLKGKVDAATASQKLFNLAMNLNPVSIAITATAALVAGIAAYTIMTDKAAENIYALSESEKEHLDVCKEVTEALNEQRASREESIASIDREYDGYESLLAELQSITDENGNVKVGYEERAKVITGLLSDALGIEISLLDGQIQKYGEVVSAIKEVIVQKKAEAIISSMQEDMANAYEKSEEAIQAYKEASEDAAKRTNDLTEAQEALAKAEENYEEAQKSGADYTGQYSDAVKIAKENLEAATEAQEESAKTLADTKAAMEELSTEVNNYDALIDAMASNDVAKIEEAMTALVTSYQSYTSEALAASEETRQAMYDQANSYVENMKLVQDGTLSVADSVFQDMARAAANSINEFNKLPGGIAQGIKDIGPEASAAMVSALAQADLDGKLDAEGKSALENLITTFDALSPEMQETMSGTVEGAMEGLEGFDQIQTKAEEEGISFLEALREVLQINSPSKKVAKIFEGVWEGASDGLDEGDEELDTKGIEVCNSFLDSIRNTGLGEAMRDIGANIMSFFGIGVSSQQENSRAAGKANADAANSGASSVSPFGTGSAFGTLLGNGISTMKSVLFGQGKGLSDSAKSGVGSVDSSGEGKNFGKSYAGGISGQSRIAATAAATIAKAANGLKGLASVSAQSAGYSFGSGFASGIRSAIGNAVNAAVSLASNALAAVKRALDSHSPSKKAKKIGRTLPQGFGIGIEDDAKVAIGAAESMSEDALAAIDTKTLEERIKELDAPAIMTRVYAAVDDKQSRVAENMVSAVKVKEDRVWNNREKEQTISLSDEDIKKLAKAISNRPVYVVTNIDGRMASKALVRPMQQEVNKLEELQSMIGGNRV